MNSEKKVPVTELDTCNTCGVLLRDGDGRTMEDDGHHFYYCSAPCSDKAYAVEEECHREESLWRATRCFGCYTQLEAQVSKYWEADPTLVGTPGEFEGIPLEEDRYCSDACHARHEARYSAELDEVTEKFRELFAAPV